MVRDDDRRGIRGFVPMDDADRPAGQLDRVDECPAQLFGRVVRQQQGELGDRCGPDEGASDALHECGGGAVGGSEHGGDGGEGRVGDAVLQLAQQPLLPGCGVAEDRDGVEPELERRRCAPERWMGGIESQHALIIALPEGAANVLHSCADLWRRGCR